jgi:lipopolysaccharide export LptBFGC system permease protein LptF
VIGRLDLYVTKNVLGAWFAANVFFVLLTIIVELLIDGLGTIGKLIDNEDRSLLASLGLLGRYYLLRIPIIFVTVGPFVTVISSMFAIARLMGGNEITPMLFTGRSLFRVLAPTVMTAGLSAGLMGVVWEYAVPVVVHEINYIDKSLKPDQPIDERLVVSDSDGETRRTLWVDQYDPSRLRMTGVQQYVRVGAAAGDGEATAEYVVDGLHADWRPNLADWELTAGVVKTALEERPRALLGFPDLTPDRMAQIGLSSRDADALSYSQLLELQRLQGDDPTYRMAFHTHLTFPIANFVLLLLVLPFAVSFERRSRIERVLFAILACAGYLITDLTCRSIGSGGYLDPVFSAWLPPIVFGSLGLTFATGVRT